MWTDDRQRRSELVDSGHNETRAFNRPSRLAIRIAAVAHSAPERFHCGLDAAEQGSRWRGHMLNEDELAAGFEHPCQFGECPALVDNATKNQCADGTVNGLGP